MLSLQFLSVISQLYDRELGLAEETMQDPSARGSIGHTPQKSNTQLNTMAIDGDRGPHRGFRSSAKRFSPRFVLRRLSLCLRLVCVLPKANWTRRIASTQMEMYGHLRKGLFFVSSNRKFREASGAVRTRLELLPIWHAEWPGRRQRDF